MVEIENILVSNKIFNQHFVCNLNKCKGNCCNKGDAGAPILKQEIAQIKLNFNYIYPFISEKSKVATNENNFFYEDKENGEYGISLLNNRECVFAINENNTWKCAIEKSYENKKSKFLKPISCHLYPIRTGKIYGKIILKYEEWDICKSACFHGENLKIPLYKFLKKALIRFLGNNWYKEMENVHEELLKQKII